MLSLFIFILEKKIFTQEEAKKLIWPILISTYSSKQMNSQIIYVLLFYVGYALELCSPQETQTLILNFFLKCLGCNHEQTQLLAIKRMSLILPRIKGEECTSALYEKLISLWQKDSEKVVFQSMRFLKKNLKNFSKKQIHEQLFLDLCGFLKQSKKAQHSTLVFDEYYNLLIELYIQD